MAPQTNHSDPTQVKSISKATLYWLWRGCFLGNTHDQKSSQQRESGFILPTVTFVLLILSLVIGVMTFRSFSRTSQVVGQRVQQTLYNAATPAIDRAKSKLEYMFTQTGLPKLPADTDLNSELSLDRYNIPLSENGNQEIRLDLNGDGVLDNAWVYYTDANGDGRLETVAYSILANKDVVDDNGTPSDPSDDTVISFTNDDTTKAQSLVVRNGPLIQTRSNKANCPSSTSPVAGWERTSSNTSLLRKALQVHAVVINQDPTAAQVDRGSNIAATLEMQQDRQVDFGNKWGAWFRTDIVGQPSDDFRFNGAMHTEGSFIFGDNNVRLYLVSSPSSCIYDESTSEISMARRDQDGDGVDDFEGQMLTARVNDNSLNTSDYVTVDRYDSTTPSQNWQVRSDPTVTGQTVADSVRDDLNPDLRPMDIVLNPIRLFTDNLLASLGSDSTNLTARDDEDTDTNQDYDWNDTTINPVADRVLTQNTSVPYLDDTYRADDRWGPKIIYDENLDVEVPTASSTKTSHPAYASGQRKYGGTITSDPDLDLPAGVEDNYLLNNDPLATDPLDEDGFGLDGYWERRARRMGVRVIVGPRLELGNATEWDGTTDPLYPPKNNAAVGTSMASRPHELQQYRTLRDNRAAAQAAAIYHYQADQNGDGTVDWDAQEGGSYPIACMAVTNHPGTLQTDINSRTFETVKYDVNGDGDTADADESFVDVDFLTGRGTNGLEFAAPFTGVTGQTPGQAFESEVNNPSSPLRVGLANLAYFAGDPAGSFPPMQDSDDSDNANDAANRIAGNTTVGPVMHPYPMFNMWGNFSELRAVLNRLNTTLYEDLSPADQSTLHTATCTLGMLSYNLAREYSRFIADTVTGASTPGTITLTDAERQALIDDPANKAALDAKIQETATAINTSISASVGSSGGPWQSLSQRFDNLIDGLAGTGGGSAENLTWTGTCPTYAANQNEINTEVCISVQDWAAGNAVKNGVVYNNTQVSDYASYDWTNPATAVTNFLANHGGDFYASFKAADWVAATIPGDNTLAELSEDFSLILNTETTTANLTLNYTLDTTEIEQSSYYVMQDRLDGFPSMNTSAALESPPVLVGPFTYEESLDINLGLPQPIGLPLDYYGWDPDEQKLTIPSEILGTGNNNTSVETFKTGCNPAIFAGLVNSTNDQVKVALVGFSLSLCGELLDKKLTVNYSFNVSKVQTNFTSDLTRYPSLYYLSPMVQHYYNGAAPGFKDGATSGTALATVAEDAEINLNLKSILGSNYPGVNQLVDNGSGVSVDAYPADPYVAAVNSGTIVFKPLEDGLGDCATVDCTVNGTERDGAVNSLDHNEDIRDFVTYLGVKPVTSPTTETNWQIPVQVTTISGTEATAFENDRHLIKYVDGSTTTYMRPAFIDMGLFNGREQMNVRVLSMDLNLMRRQSVGNYNGKSCTWVDPSTNVTEQGADNNGKCWLPLPTLLEDNSSSTSSGALVYGFREDAIREDAIARPTRSAVSNLTCAADYTKWSNAWTKYVNPSSSVTSTITTANLLMNAVSGLVTGIVVNGFDPPKNPCTLASPKPVDFYADPERRPHGFMLVNGSDLRRLATGTYTNPTTWDTDDRGLSFISDQPAYVWGNFNLHSTDGTIANKIEEFQGTDLLAANWSNFYTRSTLNTNFARPNTDTWRSTEIITDGITTLSSPADDGNINDGDGWIPGYVEDGLLWATNTSGYNTRNSYGAMHILRTVEKPNTSVVATEQGRGVYNWLREDGKPSPKDVDSNSFKDDIYTYSDNTYQNSSAPVDPVTKARLTDYLKMGYTDDEYTAGLPIKISREGFPMYEGGTYGVTSSGTQKFEGFSYDNTTGTQRNRIPISAENTYINSVVVAGTTPLRQNQNAALPNFLRLIETWGTSGGNTLNFAGSLVQLNYSVYTNNFDVDAWEPDGTASPSGADNNYYRNGQRQWGYDVGLLYNPPGPVSRRFSTPSPVRSEYYRELPVDDAYILTLRCARYDSNGDGTVTTADKRVDPLVETTSCAN